MKKKSIKLLKEEIQTNISKKDLKKIIGGGEIKVAYWYLMHGSAVL